MMPGCAAEYCTNSSVKGFKMLCFPRDVQKRAQWITNMNQPNWVPTNNSRLCEVHFAQNMWEKPKVDGKWKLKLNAIPTIFGNEAITKTLKPKVATEKSTDSKGQQVELNLCKNSIASTEMQTDVTSLIEKVDDVNLKVGETDSDELCGTGTIGEDEKNQISASSETDNIEEDDRYKKLEKLWLKSECLRKKMNKKLRAVKKENKRLRSINVQTDLCQMIGDIKDSQKIMCKI